MERISWNAAVLSMGLAAWGALSSAAWGLEIELIAEHLVNGKSVHSVPLTPRDARLDIRYWAGATAADGGTYRTLEVGWKRRLDARFLQIAVYWRTTDPAKLSGLIYEYTDKTAVDLQVTGNGANAVLSVNLKDVAPENVDRIQRVVLRYDHDRTRQRLDRNVDAARGAGGLWEAKQLNFRAWHLATFPIAEVRNGQQALADAARAVQFHDDSGVRDTLAAAYAETGDFANAVREARRALVTLDDERRRALAMRDRGEFSEAELESSLASLERWRKIFQNNLDLYEDQEPARYWDYP